ncbi:hypothetical protein ACFV4K_11945 [Nocardia sp. NPDC059764]|uniref:hypothetical protein n=1 Tax=Nocardia sp. NPDC059764 TaxID=3346939 RepID=UPI00364C2C30
MKYTKFVATAFVAAAATGIAAGTGYAVPLDQAPVVEQAASPLHGTQQGVGYDVVVSDANDIVTKVTGGQFSLDATGQTVFLKNQAGDVVTQVPLTGTLAGKRYGLTAAIDTTGTELTLTSVSAPLATAKDIDSQGDFFGQLQHAALGGIIGGILGAFLFGIGAIPGAIIGLLVVGGQPLIDSGSAYFSGQP